jgi:hypothetical protein
MPLDSFTTAIFAGGLLAGISLAVLAAIAPDLPQVITDLRHRHARPTDDPGVLAVERAISRRFFRSLIPLGTIVVLTVAVALLSAI